VFNHKRQITRLLKYWLAGYLVIQLTSHPFSAQAADPVPANRLVYGGSWESLVGVEGGIPNRTTQCGSTIAPYTGSASTINTAIANCPANQFIQLGAGTFNLSSDITMTKSNMTLRGSVDVKGAPATIINFTVDAGINYSTTGWDIANAGQYTTISVVSGATRGSSTLTLASAPTTLAVGQILWISCPPNTQISGQSSWSAWFGTRPWTQVVRVTAINGSAITISPPINADYLSGAIQVHYRGPSDSLTLSGVENLSLLRNNGTVENGTFYLAFYGTDSCWAKNIKTYWVRGGGIHHVYVYATFRTEIRHCEISHISPDPSNSSNAYAILIVHSAGALIEDNYFHDLPNVMPMFGMSGSAFAYNYITDEPYPASPTWLSQIVFFHGSDNHYNLFEGNWGLAHYHNNTGGDTHSLNNVFFRERLLGWDANPPPTGKTGNTETMSLESHQDNVVMAGNVLGENGVHTVYIGGTPNGGGDNAIIDADPTSASTLLRLANYNTVNSAIPAAEALVAGNALVTSYLHASKPSWFGNLPWPWVDPTNYTQSNNPQNFPAGYRAVNGVDPGGSAPPSPCDVNGDGVTNVVDVQLEVNMALGISPCTNPDSQCTVVQVQRVVNAALGGTCVSP